MRTTLSIDDDVLAVARVLAERQKKSVGEVVSDLARRGLLPKAPGELRSRNGVPLLPGRRGATVTMELVNRLREESA